MKKRNVVCFISSYPPNRARLSEYAQALLSELSKRPTVSKINVIADYAKGAMKSEQKGKILIHRLWKPDNIISILSILLHILKMNPDIVHFNVHFASFGKSRIANFVGLSLGFICNILGKKTLITIHNLGEMVDLDKCHVKPSLINKIGIILATKLISMVSCVTVTVRSYISYLQKRYRAKKVMYIPHGVWKNEYTYFNYANYDNKNRKKILAFGHMGPYKGLPILLKAFNMLVMERSDVELLVGGGNHPSYLGFLDDLKKLAISNVKFLGYVDETEVPSIFNDAAIVVLPYLTMTGTSGVFHLACGYGKPIIASDLPETRELMKEGACAFLIPVGQPEILRDAIRYLLDNPKIAYDFGHRNYEYAHRHTWDKIAEKFEKIYCTL